MTLTSKKPLWWFAAILAAILYYVYYEVSLKKVKPWPVALRLITDEEAARTPEIVMNPGDPPLGIVLHNDRWTPIIHFQGGQRTYEEYPRELHYEYFLADGRSVHLTATAYSCPRDETGKEYPASPSRLVRFRGPDGDLLKITCR